MLFKDGLIFVTAFYDIFRVTAGYLTVHVQRISVQNYSAVSIECQEAVCMNNVSSN